MRLAIRVKLTDILFWYNRFNQEKVFYFLLLEYRKQHLENYPGTEHAPGNSGLNQHSGSSLQPPKSIIGHAQQHGSGNAAYRHNRQYQNEPLGTGDYRPNTKGKGHATESDDRIKDNSQNLGPTHHLSRERYTNNDDLKYRRSVSHSKVIASRSSLINPMRHSSRGSGRRGHHSKASLVSYMGSSPSAYRSVKHSHSKRHVSFNHHRPTSKGGSRLKLAACDNVDQDVWVDEDSRFDREDTPEFREMSAALLPKSRGEYVIGNSVVADHQAPNIRNTGGVVVSKNRMLFTREKEEAERRRKVSQELEEACERAFNSSVIRSSLTSPRTIRSLRDVTVDHVSSVTDASNSPGTVEHATVSTQTDYSGSFFGTTKRKLPSPPCGSSNLNHNDGKHTLYTLEDDGESSKSGCLDAVIEHLDRLMDSSAIINGSEKPRAVSQGGKPLNMGGLPINSRDHPNLMGRYLDEEEIDHQKHLLTRTNIRNVSTPNPQRTSDLIGHDTKSASISMNVAPLNIRPRSTARRLHSDLLESKKAVCIMDEAFKPDSITAVRFEGLAAQRGDSHDGDKNSKGSNRNSLSKDAGLSAHEVVGKDMKKKRSFLEIFTGKKTAKDLKNRIGSVDDHPGTTGTVGTREGHLIGITNSERITFGKRSGNALRRFVSRDVKKEEFVSERTEPSSLSLGKSINHSTSTLC